MQVADDFVQQLEPFVAIVVSTEASIRARQAALEEFRHVVGTLVIPLPDKVVQRLLGILYSSIKSDRTLYARSQKTAKDNLASRLSLSALIVKDIISKCCHSIRYKTIRTFISHSLDVLPVVGEVLLSPIASTYLKSLQILLSVRFQLEHFEHSVWQACFAFLINSIENYEAIHATDDEQFTTESQVRTEVVMLISCLSSLITSPAADLSQVNLQQVLRFIEQFLVVHDKETSAHRSVMAILKNFLSYSSHNELTLSVTVSALIVRVCMRHWSTRSSSLRQELIDGLAQAIPFLRCPDMWDLLPPDFASFEFAQVLWSTILDRGSNLEPSQGYFYLQDCGGSAPSSDLGGALLRLDKTDHRASYVTLYALACLSFSSPHRVDGVDSAKRMKFNSFQDEVLIELRGSSIQRKSIALQLLWVDVVQQTHGFSADVFMPVILLCLTSEATQLQKWAQSYLTVQLTAAYNVKSLTGSKHNGIHSHDLEELWGTALRGLPSIAMCESSCLLATSLLLCGKLSDELPWNFFGQMSIHLDQCCPGICAESSCKFMLTFYTHVLRRNYSTMDETRRTVQSWLLSRIRLDVSATNNLRGSAFEDLLSFAMGASLDHFLPVAATRVGPFGDSGSSLLNTLQNILEGNYSTVTSHPMAPNQPQSLQPSCVSFALSESFFEKLLELAATKSRALSEARLQTPPIPTDINTTWLVFALTEWLWYFESIVPATSKLDLNVTWSALNKLLQEIFEETIFESPMLLAPIELLKSILGRQPRAYNNRSRCLLQTLKVLRRRTTDSKKIQTRATDIDEFDDMTRADSPSHNTADPKIELSLLIEAHLGRLEHNEEQEVNYGSAWMSQAMFILWDEDGTRLFKKLPTYLMTTILSDYRYERSSALFMFLVHILEGSIATWAVETPETSSHWGHKIFAWIVQICFTSQLTSIVVRQAMVKLCSRVLQLNSDYSPRGSDKSLRSIFLARLQDSDVRVAHQTCFSLLPLFLQFETHLHIKIFEDILALLPTDAARPEQFSTRILLLVLVAMEVESIRAMALFRLVCLSVSMTWLMDRLKSRSQIHMYTK